ncbi:MAG TPA: hypothetical protein PL010_02015 [Flavobacteriales bacterium]|nr:hypothetical protein [Flavobacteriales bacterium]HMZ47782.1 hypothetical protein [Flavobacteriales bacterium]HNE80576.1 hypothetical protein [Flavobacteriales bacterium]HNI03376.1 hypothetical protein [Flavobacteriales bacterium]HNK39804.1 hypothetical protein [Flavobacteriales bacterium]
MKALFVLLVAAPLGLVAQDYALPRVEPKPDVRGWNVGPGIGIDQGGLGLQVQCRPAPPLIIFASGGYALAGFGWNVGVGGRLLPRAKWCPYLTGMYGYNAAVVIQGAADHNKLYYGPSFGLGVEDHRRRNYANFWRFGIVIPIRPSEYWSDMAALKADPNFKISGEPAPLAISAAYHFGL